MRACVLLEVCGGNTLADAEAEAEADNIDGAVTDADAGVAGSE